MDVMKTYSEKLRDPRWQRKRLEILQRDNFTCRDCHAKDKTLHVHHCLYEKGDPWETDDRFLLTLCEECHKSRQLLEDGARLALGTLMSGMVRDGSHSGFDDLLGFAASLARATENDNRYLHVVDGHELDYLSDHRWFRYACDNPEFQTAYSYVTDSDIDWDSINTRRAAVPD